MKLNKLLVCLSVLGAISTVTLGVLCYALITQQLNQTQPSQTEMVENMAMLSEQNEQLQQLNNELNETNTQLVQRLNLYNELRQAEAEVQVRPDFNPTLGGVPYPGMNKGVGIVEPGSTTPGSVSPNSTEQ